MKIKIRMHSVLDCALEPDIDLIYKAYNEMKNEPIRYNPELLEQLLDKIKHVNKLSYKDKELYAQSKVVVGQAKEMIKQERKAVLDEIEKGTGEAFSLILSLGAMEHYHYNYDENFNRIIAGLMGSTRYKKETFDQLREKGIRDIHLVANAVLKNEHHSMFSHSHLTLEILDIPKALALVLNNEKQYNSSEKSARFTILENIDHAESELFYKWKEIFAKSINDKYGRMQPYFDENGKRVERLAVENAKYMLSAYAPSNFVFTTDYKQLNYIAHKFEKLIETQYVNKFYQPLLPYMQEFVQWVKDNKLYTKDLMDKKESRLSLLGEPILKSMITSQVYVLHDNMSLHAFARLQENPVDYHISEEELTYMDRAYHIPAIIQKDLTLSNEWLRDLQSIEEHLPQATLVPVIERGSTKDFLLKAKEAVCIGFPKEGRDLVQKQCLQFARQLKKESDEIGNAFYDIRRPMPVTLRMKSEIDHMQKDFERLSRGPRCIGGSDFRCPHPCNVDFDILV